MSGSKPVVNQEVLQVSELTKDDKTKISAALLGFTEGYKVSTLGPPDNKYVTSCSGYPIVFRNSYFIGVEALSQQEKPKSEDVYSDSLKWLVKKT